MKPFSVSTLPRIEFGRGLLSRLPEIICHYGRHLLLVTGHQSFPESSAWKALQILFRQHQIGWEHVRVSAEPSPHWVDNIVTQYSDRQFDVVLAIGGGSAIDAAKAIAGLLRLQHSVMDYLEGVGPERPYTGPTTPLIAVPTTAGTGSEATKNAVLSVHGKGGFKKSFRDEQLVAAYAIIDPDLLESCPREIIAANGMDALTQLMESYVSIKASPLSDALSISGLQAIREALPEWYDKGAVATEAQEKMAYAALLSGITLAQCGLGAVHGLASPLGAFYPVAHGVVCGTLVAASTDMNIRSMLAREPGNPALIKYAYLAELLCGRHFDNDESAWAALIDLLTDWTKHMKLPRLSHYGLGEKGLNEIITHSRGSSMKTNPIVLRDEELVSILMRRL